MSVLALAESLDRIGLDIAEAVVDEARRDYEKPPSVAQLYDVAAGIRVDQRPQLPREAWGPRSGIPMPPEIAERVHALADKLAEPSEVELTEQANKRAVAAILAGPKSRNYCNGAGQIPVQKDGKQFCPDCGVEVPDIPLSPRPKRRGDGAPFNPKVGRL